MGSIVYSQGSFDILHQGHINLLRRCRDLAGENGRVVVAVTSDEVYEQYRGYKPSQTLAHRLEVISAIKYVDIVIPIHDLDQTSSQIKTHMANWAALGSDWATKDIYAQWRMKPQELDPILVFFPYTKEVSSTDIKNKIKNDKR